MNTTQPSDLRDTMARWNTEYAPALDAAYASNLARARVFCPVVAGLNGLFALVFIVLLLSGDETHPNYRWKLWQLLNHTGMCIAMVGCATALRWAHQHKARAWRGWPLLTLVVGMGFSMLIATIDQWVTPNITPFFIACTVASLSFYLRPPLAALLFTCVWLVFSALLGLTQHNTDMLLSNRINALASCVVAWAISGLLWHRFVVFVEQSAALQATRADLQRQQDQLDQLARQDSLTGLLNRNTFAELSRNELNRAQRLGTDTTLLLLDLDHFKQVNDTWGHPAGDAVLCQVAQTLRLALRSTDLAGRMGREEFIVMLPNTTEDAGRKIAEKLRQLLQTSPTTWGDARIGITVSIGLASTRPEARRSFDALYTEADKALYLAKQRGRNRVI